MKTGILAYYTFLRHVRDFKAMVVFILLPIIMMLILGAALNNEFTPKKVDKVKVGYLSQDEGIVDTAFHQFLESEQLADLVEAEKVSTVEEGTSLVKLGEFKAFIYLPKKVSHHVLEEEKAALTFYSKDENSFIKPIVESFVREFNFNSSMMKMTGELSEQQAQSSVIDEVKIVTEGKIPRGIDYYAIATMFQSLLLGAIFGVFAITKDQGNHTNLRLQAAPVKRSSVMLGKFFGSTLVLYAISIVIFVFSKYLFQANWGGNLGIITLVLLLFSMISIGLGMIVAYLTKSTMVSALGLFVVTTVMTLVSGGFSRMEGKVIETLSRFAPNSYAHKVLFADIYKGTVDYSQLQGLFIYTGVIVILLFLVGRRRTV